MRQKRATRLANELEEYHAAKLEDKDKLLPEIRQGDTEFEWQVDMRGGRIRVSYPAAWPWRPPKFEAMPNKHNKTVPLCDTLGYRNEHMDMEWSPAMSVWQLLRGPYDAQPPLGDVLEPPFKLRPRVDVAYIAVGCGGPALAQQYPRMVQERYAMGGRVFVVLIDPFLFGANAPCTRSGAPRRRHVIRKERLYVALEERVVLPDEEHIIADAAVRLRSGGCKHVFVTDFRYGGRGTALGDVDAAYIHQPRAPRRDDVVRRILWALYGVTDVDDDVLHVTDATAAAHFRGPSCTIPGEQRLLQFKLECLQDGTTRDAFERRQAGFHQPKWLRRRINVHTRIPLIFYQ